MVTVNFTHSYQQLPSEFYQFAVPEPAPNPSVIVFNQSLADWLGITYDDGEELAQVLSGAVLPHGASPIAQAYAGHQFGHLNILGDGRAVLLGELSIDDGKLFDWQLKGSGQTPFSRNGDGKSALAPMVREYLISEAMYALGIPTTRSLGVATTGAVVHRQGRRQAAVLSRIAASHIRVGTFVYAAIIDQQRGGSDCLHALLNYSIQRHYPHVAECENPALEFLRAVMHKQIDLVNQWWRVGFIHGVLNTDNIAISGETIDYGPCAFLEHYNPTTVFSSIDRDGRYAFGRQAAVMQWNLARLAEVLLPLIDTDEDTAIELAEQCINSYPEKQHHAWQRVMLKKIGIAESSLQPKHAEILNQLLTIMYNQQLDYTNTFVLLTQMMRHNVGVGESYSDNISKGVVDYLQLESTQSSPFFDEQYVNDEFIAWCGNWQQVLFDSCTGDVGHSLEIMQNHNPMLIPRNIVVEDVLTQAEQGDMQPLHVMLDALSKPYDWENCNSVAAYQMPASPEELQQYQTFCGT
ncbi:MAG: YdiU family protein [Gammaproteobacteria bacterium]|nr:YdiU family protein [Gammaproteobacteria bacterium]